MTSRTPVPAEVRDLAERRSSARAERDWATADRLRGALEAAGWKVVDAGTEFRLEPAHPADVDVGGEVRYGRSGAVPSRLEEPPTGLASVIVVAREDPSGARRAVEGLLAHTADGVDAILVADGLPDSALDRLRPAPPPAGRLEVVRTSAALGQGAALNVGLRRSRAGVVVILDASVEPFGDAVTPLVEALHDPGVAVAGPFGLRSPDLRHFEEVEADDATSALSVVAVEGYAMAFRRADAIARGPIDEAFRFYRNLDIWWSLVLRDEGEGRPPRQARVVPGLPLRRHEHVAWSATPPKERERLSKRNFYRVLDRFRDRLDLASG